MNSVPKTPQRPSGSLGTAEPPSSQRKKPLSAAQKLALVMEHLAKVDWSIGDLLYMLFRTRDESGNPISHPKSLETSLSHFLSGRTLHTPIEIIQLWHIHPYSDPATTPERHEPHYSFMKPYLEVKHAKAAITAMVVQLCEKALLRETLRSLARQNALEITRLGVDIDRWFIARFDNVQQQFKLYEQRIGRESTMHIGVAGTVAEAKDFVPSAADLDDRLMRLQQGLRKDLTIEKLLGMIDFDHLEQIASFQWLQTLINYVPALHPYKKDITKTYHDISKLLVPTSKTQIHTLAPVAKNEAVTTDLRDTIVDFLRQLGQSEDSYLRRLALMGGDGLTFEKMVKIKQYLQGQVDEFKRFDIIMPFLETWHTQWTYLCSIFQVHFDESGSQDPSKLGHSMTKMNQKGPSNLKRVEYYKGCFAAYKTLEARQIDCWRYRVLH
ncbi:hypothetical protein GSI_13251 [Ganoderma sinense ZZ0214-1]|uniref:DUF6589 domain-containing protein n=1 Tax=Ganoderma sinense ZZ0214-1 TaxID=1077348 RepID=A0A2G8RV24_9APHY|nr:hypothetical protein GSI_13251 [Ganoderma sinense ZZ0214-1]